MSSTRPTKDAQPDAPPPPKKGDRKIASDAKPKSLDKDDNIDDSFYKGKGGCYTMDEQGRVVPIKES